MSITNPSSVLSTAFKKVSIKKTKRIHLHEEMEEMSSSAVERQALAYSDAQGRRLDPETTGPCLVMLNFCTCSLTHASRSPSQSSIHHFFLRMGDLPYMDAPSPPPFIHSWSLLHALCTRAFDSLSRVIRPEKRLMGITGLGKSLSVLQRSKNSYHLLSTYYVLCSLHSKPHFFLTSTL